MILKQGMATLTDSLGLLLEQLEAHHNWKLITIVLIYLVILI